MAKKIEIEKEVRDKAIKELIDTVKKNLVQAEAYAGFLQSKESAKDVTAEELATLGSTQKEELRLRQYLEYLLLIYKDVVKIKEA